MAQILVRNLTQTLVKRLKSRAKKNGRSLQSEVKKILEQVSDEPKKVDKETALKMLAKFRRRFKGRKFPDSVELIRQERDARENR